MASLQIWTNKVTAFLRGLCLWWVSRPVPISPGQRRSWRPKAPSLEKVRPKLNRGSEYCECTSLQPQFVRVIANWMGVPNAATCSANSLPSRQTTQSLAVSSCPNQKRPQQTNLPSLPSASLSIGKQFMSLVSPPSGAGEPFWVATEVAVLLFSMPCPIRHDQRASPRLGSQVVPSICRVPLKPHFLKCINCRNSDNEKPYPSSRSPNRGGQGSAWSRLPGAVFGQLQKDTYAFRGLFFQASKPSRHRTQKSPSCRAHRWAKSFSPLVSPKWVWVWVKIKPHKTTDLVLGSISQGNPF